MNGKCEKLASATMGHLPKLKNNKNGGLRECGRRRSGCFITCRPNFVVTSPLSLIFTKLPLCHS